MAKKKAAAKPAAAEAADNEQRITAMVDGALSPPAKVNKSELIRAAISEHPELGVTAIAKLLTQQLGETISPAYVSAIKSKMEPTGTATPSGTRGAKKAHGKPVAPGTALTAIDRANAFVDSAGGIEQAQQILAAIAKMTRF